MRLLTDYLADYRRTAWPILAMLSLLVLAACGGNQAGSGIADGGATADPSQGRYKVGNPYEINGVMYYPKEDYSYDETGIASWYGPGFHNRLTANGEIFDQYTLTAAHPTLQMPSLVRVTNLENGRSVVLRVNDRGPFVNGRLIDVSRRGAELLGFRSQGTARVRVQILPEESRQVAALARQGRGGTPPPVPEQSAGPIVVAAPAGSVTSEPLSSSSPIPTEPAAAAPTSTPTDPGPPTVIAPTVELPDGDIAPQPVVIQEPVTPSSIFVQAGAFSVYQNATQLRDRLSSITTTQITTAMVDGTEFYRVRLGPLSSVDDADQVLASVINAGETGARIIVD